MRILKRGYWIILLFVISSSVERRLFAEQTATEEMSTQEVQALEAKKQQAEIRKILSSEPDPSLMLEPIPDPPEDKRKKVPPKPERPMAPAERAVAAQAAGQPLSLGGSLTGNSNGGAPAGSIAPAANPASPVSANALNPMASALNPTSPAGGKANLRMGRLHGEAPPSPEVAIILHGKQFFPSRIRLKAGVPTKVYFTTTAERPAAIVVEQLQVQKWLAKDGNPDRKIASEYDRAKFEVTREVVANKMTEITFEPRRGTYGFHDAISGAKGQIVVE